MAGSWDYFLLVKYNENYIKSGDRAVYNPSPLEAEVHQLGEFKHSLDYK